MNLHRMELVLKVAEFRSFTKAAEALKIPQPSLSQSILSLERSFLTARVIPFRLRAREKFTLVKPKSFLTP